MARYKMLVGVTVYYEVPIESDNVEDAKNKINNIFTTYVGTEGNWTATIQEKVEIPFTYDHIVSEYSGIKEGSIREIQETVTVVG